MLFEGLNRSPNYLLTSFMDFAVYKIIYYFFVNLLSFIAANVLQNIYNDDVW